MLENLSYTCILGIGQLFRKVVNYFSIVDYFFSKVGYFFSKVDLTNRKVAGIPKTKVAGILQLKSYRKVVVKAGKIVGKKVGKKAGFLVHKSTFSSVMAERGGGVDFSALRGHFPSVCLGGQPRDPFSQVLVFTTGQKINKKPATGFFLVAAENQKKNRCRPKVFCTLG